MLDLIFKQWSLSLFQFLPYSVAAFQRFLFQPLGINRISCNFAVNLNKAMHRSFYFYLVFFSLLYSCTPRTEKQRIITVTIEPLRYFTEQIVDSFLQVNTLVPPGTSPETYDPTPGQMVELSRSEVYMKIGYIGFEQVWMDKIAANNPQLQIIDTSRGIDLIASEEECEAGEHDGHHHHHGPVDPHTWSSPKQAITIIRNIYEAAIKLYPEHHDEFTRNYLSLKKEVEETDSLMTQLLSSVEPGAFIIYHPALTYLAKDYGLTQYCIEFEGKEPSPDLLQQLVNTAREQNIKIIFVQQEFDRKNAEIIAKETGCKLVTINPLSYHWKEEIIHIAKALSGNQ